MSHKTRNLRVATKILFLIFLSLINYSIAQRNDFYFSSLQRHPWRGNNAFLDKVLFNYPKLDSGRIYYRIPLSYHIFLNSRESLPFLNASIKKSIQNLNRIYALNNTGIQFYVADIHYYKQYRHLSAGYFLESFFIELKHHNPYAINLYYVNSLRIKIFRKKRYYNGVHNSLTKSIIIVRHANRTTLAHEIGHFLGLMHPHRHWKGGRILAEPVSRTKTNIWGTPLCEKRGDYLSDTPAEPSLSKFCDKNCKYNGNLTDPWGDLYHPDTDNIMSYVTWECRKRFTKQQKAVMLYKAEHYKASKKWKVTAKNDIFGFDKYEPDNVETMASQIKTDRPQIHTFHCYPFRNKIISDSVDYLQFEADSNFYSVKFMPVGADFTPLWFILLNKKGKALFIADVPKPANFKVFLPKGTIFIRVCRATQKKHLGHYKIIIQKN